VPCRGLYVEADRQKTRFPGKVGTEDIGAEPAAAEERFSRRGEEFKPSAVTSFVEARGRWGGKAPPGGDEQPLRAVIVDLGRRFGG